VNQQGAGDGGMPVVEFNALVGLVVVHDLVVGPVAGTGTVCGVCLCVAVVHRCALAWALRFSWGERTGVHAGYLRVCACGFRLGESVLMAYSSNGRVAPSARDRGVNPGRRRDADRPDDLSAQLCTTRLAYAFKPSGEAPGLAAQIG